MREKTFSVFAFGEEDYRIIKLLSKLGMNKNIAKTMVYMSQVEECYSDEIEKGAEMRQEQVSIAMGELVKKGWIVKIRDDKKGGKGRPIHIYKTEIRLPDVLKIVRQQKNKEIGFMKNTFSELKDIDL